MLNQSHAACFGLEFILKARTGETKVSAQKAGRIPSSPKDMTGMLHTAIKGLGHGELNEEFCVNFSPDIIIVYIDKSAPLKRSGARALSETIGANIE